VERTRVDDLLQPTLAGREEAQHETPPFRLSSQVYVAFFGGALAVGAIGAFNAALLQMPRRQIAAIAAIALALEAALIVAFGLADLENQARIASSVAGLIAFGGIFLIQRSADRVYHFHTRADEPYQSLFVPGLIAVIAARIVEAALISLLAG
jgi:hypothetical protein